ncbi:uncharacterized protein BCR38DRAFT_67026 [Pseudomassariella vexata]|uniref:Uncharacterized protein n=1 Tax=Pseudomassariella vexata TaxID=1141098 RepID=A0A1Y2DJ24_9PEZI|nr:uncharacterized protein BCR38DRAFT_67026 [Pseudomassariella vexata]ORY59248.1 hypothetical protein BCR38DRAFT_67026 [Pseudomassariella vexata]
MRHAGDTVEARSQSSSKAAIFIVDGSQLYPCSSVSTRANPDHDQDFFSSCERLHASLHLRKWSKHSTPHTTIGLSARFEISFPSLGKSMFTPLSFHRNYPGVKSKSHHLPDAPASTPFHLLNYHGILSHDWQAGRHDWHCPKPAGSASGSGEAAHQGARHLGIVAALRGDQSTFAFCASQLTTRQHHCTVPKSYEQISGAGLSPANWNNNDFEVEIGRGVRLNRSSPRIDPAAGLQLPLLAPSWSPTVEQRSGTAP